MRLKEIRTARGITQSKLSELSEVSQSKICEYEAEKVVPRVDAVMKLARALGCTLDELMGFEKRAG